MKKLLSFNEAKMLMRDTSGNLDNSGKASWDKTLTLIKKIFNDSYRHRAILVDDTSKHYDGKWVTNSIISFDIAASFDMKSIKEFDAMILEEDGIVDEVYKTGSLNTSTYYFGWGAMDLIVHWFDKPSGFKTLTKMGELVDITKTLGYIKK